MVRISRESDSLLPSPFKRINAFPYFREKGMHGMHAPSGMVLYGMIWYDFQTCRYHIVVCGDHAYSKVSQLSLQRGKLRRNSRSDKNCPDIFVCIKNWENTGYGLHKSTWSKRPTVAFIRHQDSLSARKLFRPWKQDLINLYDVELNLITISAGGFDASAINSYMLYLPG